MYFITTKRMLEVCFSAHPNIQYRTFISILLLHISPTAPLYPLAAVGSGEWKQLPL